MNCHLLCQRWFDSKPPDSEEKIRRNIIPEREKLARQATRLVVPLFVFDSLTQDSPSNYGGCWDELSFFSSAMVGIWRQLAKAAELFTINLHFAWKWRRPHFLTRSNWQSYIAKYP